MMNKVSTYCGLRDTDISKMPSDITLYSSQRFAFEHVNRLLADMGPFSNEETEPDLDNIERNIVSLSKY